MHLGGTDVPPQTLPLARAAVQRRGRHLGDALHRGTDLPSPGTKTSNRRRAAGGGGGWRAGEEHAIAIDSNALSNLTLAPPVFMARQEMGAGAGKGSDTRARVHATAGCVADAVCPWGPREAPRPTCQWAFTGSAGAHVGERAVAASLAGRGPLVERAFAQTVPRTWSLHPVCL